MDNLPYHNPGSLHQEFSQ